MGRIFLIFILMFSLSFSQDVDDDMLDEFDDDIKVEQKQSDDPFESYNIFMTNFNDNIYHSVWKPTATAYKNGVNKDIRKSIENVFLNLGYPINFINNILQFKIKNAAIETERFIINSTLGMFGLFDIAKTTFGLEPKKEDFGQTLGYWGVGSGPHIVLPFFGPSNLRDVVSFYPDGLVNPVIYNENRNYNVATSGYMTVGLTMYERLNTTSLNIEIYDSLTNSALSKYQVLKTSYEQKRKREIHE